MSSINPHLVPYDQRLPFELWEACWSHVSFKDAKSLSLTCKLFRRTCMPQIFESMSFFAPIVSALTEQELGPPCDLKADNQATLLSIQNRLHAQISLFDQLAATETSEIRAMVKHWTFSGNETLYQGEAVDNQMHSQAFVSLLKTYTHIYDAFFNHLPHYPTLHHLSLVGIQVDDRVIDLLTTLPSLKDLHLFYCHFICEAVHHLKLRSLDIEEGDVFMVLDDHRPHTAAAFQFFCRGTLERLAVRAERWVGMVISPPYVLEMRPLTHLALKLSASTAAQNEFLRFLLQCPNLQSLTVQSVWVDMQCEAPPLASLQTYDGPMNLAKILLPRTAVQTVCLRHFKLGHFDRPLDHPKLSSALASLSFMAQSLRCLRIIPIHQPTRRVFDLIAELFPNISNLELEFENRSQVNLFGPRDIMEVMEAMEVASLSAASLSVASISAASPLSVLLDQMSTGMCVLPHAIQQLELRCHQYNVITTTPIRIPTEMQQRMVLGLSKNNPTLRRVAMGEIWMLIGDVWIQG
ncbi:hypothetical protein FIBSPDRAFT_509714 [Athelia psychrophila]|uniref:F-box domain-containing protein n=1 Tax=Athelia psychrophila TaxID=1759441 RepID=A0A166JZ40_9AGAM|nr:hypothetical protein FIBSPDRAFT_509714 [Fibularhizoctonia sp. CBS 109695]